MKAWKIGLLAVVTCMVQSASGDCTTCTTAKVPKEAGKVLSFFNTKHVTVYLSDTAKAAHVASDHPNRFDARRVENALNRWAGENGACTGMPGIPTFTFEPESPVPTAFDPHTMLLVDYKPDEASDEDTESGAELQAEQEGSLINLYGVCRTYKHACNSQNHFLWGTDYGEQIIAHEIGHVLGVGHDKATGDGCKSPGLMTESSWSDQSLKLLPEYCDMASRLNDLEQACALEGKIVGFSVHPCQLCSHEVTGSVSGLPRGDLVTINLYTPTNQGGPYDGSRMGSGAIEFKTGVPEDFAYEVTASPASPDVQCTVTNGEGVMGTEDVTDVMIECICTRDEGGASSVSFAAFVGDVCGENSGPEGPEGGNQPVDGYACFVWPQLCGQWPAPWFWWWDGGPPTGKDEPCKTETVCELVVVCDSLGNCQSELTCKDHCVEKSTVHLTGPRIFTDPIGGAVGGIFRLTGYAEDEDGLRGVIFMLDQEPLEPANLEMNLLRPDACSGKGGDCNMASGFAAELDASNWSDGSHTITIIALDANDPYPLGTYVDRPVMVDNTCTSTSAPAVEITAPIPGAVLAGPVSVRATAGGETPVARVQYYLDGVRVTTDWTAPYAWPWDTTTVPDGFHELRARAVDTCGVGTDSAPVVVEVLNANDPPRVELETPIAWATLAGTAVEVSGWALDEDGIASVSLRLNGQVVATAGALEVRERAEVCSAFGSPDPRCPNVGWALRFDSTQVPDGAYTLQVVATDGRGGTASMSRQVTIGNAPPAPPGVSVPQSVTAALGDTVVFQVTASGAGPFGYQWQVRRDARWWNLAEGDLGGRMTGVATSAMTIAALEYGDAGGYRCMVTNAGGTRASGSASLTVLESIEAPTVTSGIDQLVVEGGNAQLTVSAEGFAPLSYRWQKWNGSAYLDLTSGGGITGTTGPVLSVTGAILTHGGLYRCRVTNPGGTTVSAPIRLTVDPDLTGSCVAGPTKLCLLHDRFQAEVVINGSAGQVRPYSNLGGFFTLGNPANVEVAVKVLDGVGVNGRYWVFHGSMTSHAYTLTVTDTVTGATKTYQKAAGSFCGVADTAAFSNPESGGAPLLAALVVPLRATAASTTGSCQSTTTAQCLLGDRFRVQVYRNGFAQRAVPVSALSAAFTFGSTANPEVVAKVLDGTVVNDWYWVFFGSLTGQSYEVRVTDTTDGTVKVYPSPGPSCGVADTTAF